MEAQLRSFAESQRRVCARAWAQELLEDALPAELSCSREEAVWVILKVPQQELPPIACNSGKPSFSPETKPSTEFPSLSGHKGAAAASLVARWGGSGTEVASQSVRKPTEGSSSSAWAGSGPSSLVTARNAVPAADDLMAHVWAARPQNTPNLSSRLSRSITEVKGSEENEHRIARNWGSLVAGTALAGFSLHSRGSKSNDRLVGAWFDPGPATDPPPVVAALQFGLQCLHAARQPEGWGSGSARKVLQSPDGAKVFGAQLLQDLQPVARLLPTAYASVANVTGDGDASDRSIDATESSVDVDEDEDALRSTDASGDPCVVSSGQPFDPLQDSRHHFRSRAQVNLYQNRQRALDEFQQMLRAFRDSQEAVNPHVGVAFERELSSRVRSFLDQLLPANAGWFAQCFVRELIRSGMVVRQEHDARLFALADPRRVHQLHARVTADPTPPKTTAPRQKHSRRSHAGGAGKERAASAAGGKKRKAAARVTPKPVAAWLSSEPASATPSSSTSTRVSNAASLAEQNLSRESDLMRLFPASQRFFALFLRHADSHRLASQLQTWLVASIVQSSPLVAISGPSDDSVAPVLSVRAAIGPTQVESHLGGLPPLRSLLGRIQRSRICARFLGLLLFSPGWELSDDALKGAAVDSALRDTVRCVNLVDPPLDLGRIIDTAVRRKSLITVVPWACDFLRMLRDDRIAASSSRYRDVLDKLRAIHWRLLQSSIRPTSSSPLTRARVAVMWHIESLFRFLGLPLLRQAGSIHDGVPGPDSERGPDDDAEAVGRRCLVDVCPSLEALRQESDRLRSNAHDTSVAPAGTTSGAKSLEKQSADAEEGQEDHPAFRIQPFYSPRKVRPVQTTMEERASGDGSAVAQRLAFGESAGSDGLSSSISAKPQEDATFALAETLLLAPSFQQHLRRSFLGRYPAIQRLLDASVDTVLENCLPKAAQEAAAAACDEAVRWFRQSAASGPRASPGWEDLWQQAAATAGRTAVEQAERLAVERAIPVVDDTVRAGLQLHDGTDESSPGHTSVAHVAASVARQSLQEQVHSMLPRRVVATVQAIMESKRRQEMKAIQDNRDD